MNAVTERDVMCKLVEFAVDRDLSSISAGVGRQRKPIAAWDNRLRNHKITVVKKLQNSNTSAGNHAMASRVSRMGWRTFGECLREKVITVSAEASLHSGRVENVVVDAARKRSSLASQNL